MVTCPLCNAMVRPPAGARAGEAMACPRCEETFRLTSDFGAEAVSGIGGVGVAEQPVRRGSNRLVALGVLCVMAIMATIGLIYALNTKADRRKNDTGLVRGPARLAGIPDRQPVKPVAPLELMGLRYLPSDADVVAGVHLAELLDKPELLKVRGGPTWLGDVARLGERVKELTGLELDSIDHVVFGTTVGRRYLIPPVIVVVRTRGEYREASVRKALGAEPHPGKRQLFRFEKKLLPWDIEGLVAFADARTIVLTWNVRDRDVPEKPQADSTHLPASVRSLLSERSPMGPVWFAGDVGDLPKLLEFVRGRLPRYEAEMKLLSTLRTFVFWLADEEGPVFRGVVRCADAAAATDAAQALRSRFGMMEKLTIIPREKKKEIEVQYRP